MRVAPITLSQAAQVTFQAGSSLQAWTRTENPSEFKKKGFILDLVATRNALITLDFVQAQAFELKPEPVQARNKRPVYLSTATVGED